MFFKCTGKYIYLSIYILYIINRKINWVNNFKYWTEINMNTNYLALIILWYENKIDLGSKYLYSSLRHYPNKIIIIYIYARKIIIM